MNTTINYPVIDALSQILKKQQKIVLQEDTSLLVMNSLYSSNHRKEEKKESIKFVQKIWLLAGFKPSTTNLNTNAVY